MKCFLYIVLLLLIAGVKATFWYKNDDFERVMDPYKSSVSQDYLRALSIFKRKLQLLGFYPLVLNDDGLEYVSMDPYIIADDDDDEMYKLLKKMKKEKKARKKSLKKKAKKSKKVAEPPAATTTVQPISNIVYYWPSQITTIVHPGQSEGTSTYQHSFDARFGINDSSEENSSEADNDSNDQILKNDKERPAKINYQTSFTFEGKFDDGDKQIRENRNQTLTSSPTATTTTPYPLITVYPDREDVAVQEIIDQQEIVNKISENGKGNITKTSVEDHVDRTTKDSTIVQENVIKTDTTVQATGQGDVYEENPSNFQETKIVDKIPEKNFPSEPSISVTPDTTFIASIDVATESSIYSSEPPQPVPTGVLQFFHETLPDEPHVPNGLHQSEIVDNIPVSSSTDTSISEPFTEIPENNSSIDGHRETDSQYIHYTVELNTETATGSPPQPLDQQLTPPKSIDNGTILTELEVTIPMNQITNESEGYEYSIDPKITHPSKVVDFVKDFESRSLTDAPVVVDFAVDDKSGRRSDVPIEADDANEEDTTDNLAYNLTVDNLLEQSKVVENTSAETSTPASVDTPNYDNSDQFDGEIIPLIPIIIKQMKQGNVSPEEMEILKNSFGPFWPFIAEEASRESDSSEDMNPMLSELLNTVNKKIVKREATWRRPISGRRLYLDDDDDDFEIVSRRRYYGGRRRPYRRYYQKK